MKKTYYLKTMRDGSKVISMGYSHKVNEEIFYIEKVYNQWNITYKGYFCHSEYKLSDAKQWCNNNIELVLNTYKTKCVQN